MKRCFSFAAGLLYVLSAATLLFYFVISLSPYLRFSPTGRIVCLGGSCLCLYLGSLLLAKTLLRERAAHVMKVTFAVMFAAYLLLLLTFTLFDTYFTRSGFSALRDADLRPTGAICGNDEFLCRCGRSGATWAFMEETASIRPLP